MRPLISSCQEIIVQDNFLRAFRSSKWNFSHIFNKLKMAALPCAAQLVPGEAIYGQALIKWMIVALLWVMCQTGAWAQQKKVYVHTDENGVLVFTDKPQPGAKEVNLNQRQQLTMPSVDTAIFDQLTAEQDAKKPQYQIFIDLPQDQSTIRDNRGDIYVSGHVTPSFRTGFKVRLLLDGKQRQKPHNNAIFRLRNVDRGEHTLVLELLDSQGQILAKSDPRTIYLFRASAIKPSGG